MSSSASGDLTNLGIAWTSFSTRMATPTFYQHRIPGAMRARHSDLVIATCCIPVCQVLSPAGNHRVGCGTSVSVLLRGFAGGSVWILLRHVQIGSSYP